MGLLLPWWLKWAALLLLVVGAFGFGLVQGIDHESMRRDAKDAAAMRAFDAARLVYVREVIKIKKVYIERRQADVKLRVDIVGEVAKHASEIPDPPQCWLDDRRVQSINRAIEPGPDRSGAAAGLRTADASHFWPPSGGGGVGDVDGLQLPGVLGPAQGPGGDGDPEAIDRGEARGG